jgi:hypothetical protein
MFYSAPPLSPTFPLGPPSNRQVISLPLSLTFKLPDAYLAVGCHERAPVPYRPDLARQQQQLLQLVWCMGRLG